MADCEVKCITTARAENGRDYITHIGNRSTKAHWRWPVEEIIASIELQTNTFFVVDPKENKRAYIQVIKPPGKAPYIQTEREGVLTDLLFQLPQCPF